VDSRFEPYQKVYFWFPTQSAQEARIDGVTEIMSGSIVDSHDCGLITVTKFDEHFRQFKIRNFISGPNIVNLADLPGPQNIFDGVAVVLDVYPISNIAPVAI
jgi:hypothetical protein